MLELRGLGSHEAFELAPFNCAIPVATCRLWLSIFFYFVEKEGLLVVWNLSQPVVRATVKGDDNIWFVFLGHAPRTKTGKGTSESDIGHMAANNYVRSKNNFRDNNFVAIRSLKCHVYPVWEKNLKIFFVLKVFYLLCFFPSTEHVFVYSTKVNSKTTTQSVFYPKAREYKLREPIPMTHNNF